MKALGSACRRLAAGLVSTLATAAAGSAEAPATPNLVLSADGAYVINVRAKLVWPRCVEGMQWSGKTCTGKPLLVDHAEAIALAAARKKAEDVRWRVPRVAELQRLVNKTASPPGPDPVLFPAAPREWHWSVTANVDTAPVNQYNYGNAMRARAKESTYQMAFLHGWAVNLETGEARGDVTKRTKLPVRLVQSQD